MSRNATIDELLADLNPQQREAVTHGEGPLLIVAGVFCPEGTHDNSPAVHCWGEDLSAFLPTSPAGTFVVFRSKNVEGG